MKNVILNITLFVIFTLSSFELIGQESIFTGFQGKLKKADTYYQNQAYSKAIVLYEELLVRDKGNATLILNLANCYYFTNNMNAAVVWYQNYEHAVNQITNEAHLNYADALLVVGDNEKALKLLKEYHALNPDNLEIAKKIWQLENINFLYEDSVLYQVKPASFNTKYDELSPEITRSSLVITGNIPCIEVIQRMEGSTDKPFFKWLFTNLPMQTDLENESEFNYAELKPYGDEIDSKFHKGALTFTASGDTMIFTRSGNVPDISGIYTTQLFFARKLSGQWQEYAAFPYNSEKYSISHPALSRDGKTLYFSSDMPGSIGGKDIYYSTFDNEDWTEPENLGDAVNTSQEESHPFIRKGVLYFSSNGHAGLGGLDVYKVKLFAKRQEIVNFGYPVNTAFDDFDLVLDSAGIYGYLVSNRNSDNDNIYELKMHKLTFPITIKGNIKYKRNENDGTGSDMYYLSNATLELIEKSTNAVVSKTTTDSDGKFAIEIPYERQFLLKVNQKNFGQAVVSMEIPENHLDYLNHEIVIVEE